MTVGAGTVITVDEAVDAVSAGASFLVSPHLDRRLLEWARANEIAFLPGGLTPTEIASAWGRGAAAVKVFPASVGGPGYLRSLLAPYPDLILVPTGGVDGDNVAAYLAAGAAAVGVGGWLTSHADLDVVIARARLLLAQVV
jgi:2-dehydro-3-deoxyphosphogluconate aldolase/(4S)-4-hydroxy-2-oxoglutarate aldolase